VIRHGLNGRELLERACPAPGISSLPWTAGTRSQIIARTALGRFGEPEDIGPVAVFLASPSSGWMTGEILQAAGGFR
jgi:3-oxoacyl-[acyl-carrier protein] reductase